MNQVDTCRFHFYEGTRNYYVSDNRKNIYAEEDNRDKWITGNNYILRNNQKL